jgi:hypothetical protein
MSKRSAHHVSDFISYLKETPTAAGFDEILYPGELEARVSSPTDL